MSCCDNKGWQHVCKQLFIVVNLLYGTFGRSSRISVFPSHPFGPLFFYVWSLILQGRDFCGCIPGLQYRLVVASVSPSRWGVFCRSDQWVVIVMSTITFVWLVNSLPRLILHDVFASRHLHISMLRNYNTVCSATRTNVVLRIVMSTITVVWLVSSLPLYFYTMTSHRDIYIYNC
jgi:hypothetical protein